MKEQVQGLSSELQRIAADAQSAADMAQALEAQQMMLHGPDPFFISLTVFALACFVGYYVVWKVTPALHTPLMAVTNAISGIIVVGAIIAVGAPTGGALAKILGFFAVMLAAVNIFGGFMVTHRMLEMFKKKAPAHKEKAS